MRNAFVVPIRKRELSIFWVGSSRLSGIECVMPSREARRAAGRGLQRRTCSSVQVSSLIRAGAHQSCRREFERLVMQDSSRRRLLGSHHRSSIVSISLRTEDDVVSETWSRFPRSVIGISAGVPQSEPPFRGLVAPGGLSTLQPGPQLDRVARRSRNGGHE
jgi:hypothetical protein